MWGRTRAQWLVGLYRQASAYQLQNTSRGDFTSLGLSLASVKWVRGRHLPCGAAGTQEAGIPGHLTGPDVGLDSCEPPKALRYAGVSPRRTKCFPWRREDSSIL